jgi:hypothetical protein
MTVLFRNLRAFGYGERFTIDGSDFEVAEAKHFCFSSHGAHLGRWRARACKLFRHSIFAPYTMSVGLRSPTRIPNGLTIPNSFLHCIFSGSAFSHYRRSYHAVGPFVRGVSPASRSPSLNGCIPYRLYDSRPWIDALSLFILTISWLGKFNFCVYALTGADPLKALSAWTRLVIWLPCRT